MINKKGFTLIELLLVLGIIGIVSTMVFSIFITNIKNFERNQKKIEVQQNMRTAVEFMSREVIETKGILEIKDINRNKINIEELKKYKNKEIEIKYIIFSTLLETRDRYEYNRKIFALKSNKLVYGHIRKNMNNITETSANMEISFYINKITIEPILDELDNQKGISFTIYTKERYDIKPIKTSIYFRNMEV
ncbi:PilW family protein [Senegalia massiliensis]|uniref:PilW family protein n=1 Tax=Senegalia massiliensis TaxID=1720316 RepID=UPI0010302757|nr:type II secretion system protein [Senegalia massiliensis]